MLDIYLLNTIKSKDFYPNTSQNLLLWQHRGSRCRENLCYFHVRDSYLTEVFSTEINLKTNFIICIERAKAARYFNVFCWCDVFSVASARALHVRFVNDK